MNINTLRRIFSPITNLQQHERYLAAFLFELEDPFIKVITSEDSCLSLNHVILEEKAYGISFVSFDQFEQGLQQRKDQNRRPSMLDNALILFDKTGELHELQKVFHRDAPIKPGQKDHQPIRFTVFNADNKIRYAFENGDELSALLGMHTSLQDILKIHYQLNGKFFKSDKYMLSDLPTWDNALLLLLKDYLIEYNATRKYQCWCKMTDHILEPLGGRKHMEQNNCNCGFCVQDLVNVSSFSSS